MSATSFVIPSQPTPRECYDTETHDIETRKGTWNKLHVTVYRLTKAGTGAVITRTLVGEYSRNYPTLYHTFEPFRQGYREFALISPDYTGTSVLDLQTGNIIASEPHDGMGFCPVGFYVPDWWDVHDGSIKPGDEYWDEDMEWPVGDFGFVWGCVWGDDSSWKVQYLDLSRIQSGEIHRDDRFGYFELATVGDDPRDFIRVWDEGKRVQMAGWSRFKLEKGTEDAG